ncbi:MAG: GIY-YIG nuclease family protein [Lachnospira eligens]
MVHKELAQYRIRNDREFFILSYSKAREMIEKILIDNNMMYYKYDNKEK